MEGDYVIQGTPIPLRILKNKREPVFCAKAMTAFGSRKPMVPAVLPAMIIADLLKIN